MKRVTMTLAAVALVACGVGGLTEALMHEGPVGDEPDGFSPLFGGRLEIGVNRLDQDPERIWSPQMAGQRVMIIHSGTLSSICLGSACGGSICLGSGCVSSVCLGSGCVNSNCAGSACLNSTCLGSLCVGSKCFGSACTACAEGPSEESPA